MKSPCPVPDLCGDWRAIIFRKNARLKLIQQNLLKMLTVCEKKRSESEKELNTIPISTQTSTGEQNGILPLETVLYL